MQEVKQQEEVGKQEDKMADKIIDDNDKTYRFTKNWRLTKLSSFFTRSKSKDAEDEKKEKEGDKKKKRIIW